ncbi:MAG: benzoate-CoA ligase family protein [Thermoanaerobaculia bacterium]
MPEPARIDSNLADWFLDARVREGKGERVALHWGEERLTYAEVRALAGRFANALKGAGMRPEERVMIALPDGPSWVGAFFGILAAGGVVIMVNPALEPSNLAALFDYTGARWALVDEAVEPLFTEARQLAQRAPETLALGGGTFGAAVAAAAEELAILPVHLDDPAIWLFSGGTTGLPKAVVQTHRSFVNTTRLYAQDFLGYREDDVTLSVPKLFFGYATGSNLLFPFSVGASTVLFPEKPTPDVLFELVRRHRPTILVNVPTMVNQMVGHPEATGADLSSLRFATSAGEALPVPLYHRWKETFGVELLDGLGTAEMWHIFVSNRPGEVRPGTLGKAVPGFDVRVRDDEGRDLPDGEVGRLWVAGDSRAVCYWRNMGRTREAFRGEWFVGGDLVSRDAEGWITYCGRGDDVLKVAGKWLAPQEVESCLMRHPAVAECAVVGVENEDGLTKPIAFVVAREAPPELEETLKRHCLDSMAPYKHPRRVLVLDDFPRTHLGKIDRGALRRLAVGATETAP